MTTYTRPVTSGTPTTGQVVKAAHVNEPVDQIYDTILAGGITSDQIAAGAVDTSELATEAVTSAKMDGTLPDASAMATSAAPTLDKQLANKKYVDDTVGAPNWTPTDYANDGSGDSRESITYPNGKIEKTGIIARSGSTTTVTFDTAFPNGIVSVMVAGVRNSTSNDLTPMLNSVTTSSFEIKSGSPITSYYWTAVGF